MFIMKIEQGTRGDDIPRSASKLLCNIYSTSMATPSG